jgi:hypothetical protein
VCVCVLRVWLCLSMCLLFDKSADGTAASSCASGDTACEEARVGGALMLRSVKAYAAALAVVDRCVRLGRRLAGWWCFCLVSRCGLRLAVSAVLVNASRPLGCVNDSCLELALVSRACVCVGVCVLLRAWKENAPHKCIAFSPSVLLAPCVNASNARTHTCTRIRRRA